MRNKIFGVLFVYGLLVIGAMANPLSAFCDLQPAPDIKLTDLNGNKFKLSDYKGKVIIVNFWAVWCPPCKAEIPHLIKLNDKYKADGLVIIGIAIDSGKDEKIRKKAEEFTVNYPIINGDDSSIRKSFPPVRAVPTSLIINKEGQIFNNYQGFNEAIAKQVEEDIKTLLKQ